MVALHSILTFEIQLMVKIVSPGLFILLVLYIVGGAELFILLEAPKEEEARTVIIIISIISIISIININIIIMISILLRRGWKWRQD